MSMPRPPWTNAITRVALTPGGRGALCCTCGLLSCRVLPHPGGSVGERPAARSGGVGCPGRADRRRGGTLERAAGVRREEQPDDGGAEEQVEDGRDREVEGTEEEQHGQEDLGGGEDVADPGCQPAELDAEVGEHRPDHQVDEAEHHRRVAAQRVAVDGDGVVAAEDSRRDDHECAAQDHERGLGPHQRAAHADGHRQAARRRS